MSTIIGIASIKGGVGKSTIAANIVGWLAALGYSTILVDCDEKGNQTSSEWIAEALPSVAIYRINDASDLWDELPTLRRDAEFVIVDTPGTSEMIRQAFMRCDVAIIPSKTGRAEARPLIESVRICRQAQEIRSGAPQSHVVLSQVRRRLRNTREMIELCDKLMIPLAATPIALSKWHTDAFEKGTFIWNLRERAVRPFADDLDELFNEVLPETRPQKRVVNA